MEVTFLYFFFFYLQPKQFQLHKLFPALVSIWPVIDVALLFDLRDFSWSHIDTSVKAASTEPLKTSNYSESHLM